MLTSETSAKWKQSTDKSKQHTSCCTGHTKPLMLTMEKVTVCKVQQGDRKSFTQCSHTHTHTAPLCTSWPAEHSVWNIWKSNLIISCLSGSVCVCGWVYVCVAHYNSSQKELDYPCRLAPPHTQTRTHTDRPSFTNTHRVHLNEKETRKSRGRSHSRVCVCNGADPKWH